METTNSIKIKRIEVEELFGYFNYTIETNVSAPEDKLLLLYGDNGSGKTTILKLVFYLLSSQDQSGHKSKISNIKFKQFSVVLSNNICIMATREKSDFGSFTFEIKDLNIADKSIYSIFLPANKENQSYSVRIENKSEPGIYYYSMLSYIEKFNIKLFYLSDTRKSFISGLENFYGTKTDKSFDTQRLLDFKLFSKQDIMQNEESELIENTIKSLESFFKSEALKASNIGEQESNNIYLQIVEQITNPQIRDKNSIHPKIEDLKIILENVDNRTESYSKFGLVSTTEYSQIKQALSVAGEKQELIYNILEPFIRGLKVKLDALQNIQKQLDNFIGCLNSFLSFKKIIFTIQNGFNILQQQTNELIDFKDLSSGEKQLVLLFGSAILASSQATVFIIDEPEISLNVKWQRKLLSYLLQLTPNNNTQFFIATHSIELLTTQKKNVIKLENNRAV